MPKPPIPKLSDEEKAIILDGQSLDKKSSNPLAVQTVQLPFCPHRLISLRDMIKFLADNFLTDLLDLDEFQGWACEAALTCGPTIEIDNEHRTNIIALLERLDQHCIDLQLAISRHRVRRLHSRISSVSEKSCPLQVLNSELDGLLHAVWSEVGERHFAFIPPKVAEFFENNVLFGEKVGNAFPSAASHIKDAGNCFAAGFNTACVFHLMSVAEIGLRALAKHLRVKTVKRRIPLELGTWEDVIAALENKVSSHFPRSKKGERQSAFYKAAFLEYRAFKDFWRNKVMHVRIEYDEHAAHSALDHVRAFMQRLSEKVSE